MDPGSTIGEAILCLVANLTSVELGESKYRCICCEVDGKVLEF